MLQYWKATSSHVKSKRVLASFLILTLVTSIMHIMTYEVSNQGIGNRHRDFTGCINRQAERHQTLEHHCKQYGQSDRRYNPKFRKQQLESWLATSKALVLEKEKAIFCFVPKVGCSSWKVKILENRGAISQSDYRGADGISHEQPMQDIMAEYGIRPLSEYNITTAKRMLQSYFKFMFVRDPFERLLSAYRDKMADTSNQHYLPQAKRILKSFRSNLTVPTFTMFLKSLKNTPTRIYDVHWRPYDVMCNPCHVNYDVIGKLETLESDVGCVTSQLNMSSWFPLPRSARSTVDLVNSYFRSVPDDVIADVDRIYKQDAEIFGYKPLRDRNFKPRRTTAGNQGNGFPMLRV